MTAETTATYAVSLSIVQTGPTHWQSVASCPHGTYTGTSRVSVGTIEPTTFASGVLGNHQLLVACTCPPALPLNATVSFQPGNGCLPGTQRFSPQQSATLTGPNFYFGPPLHCVRFGGYRVEAKFSLSRSVTQGARGVGHVLFGGKSKITAPLKDENGRATAILAGTLNIQPWESIVIAFDNTSSQVQDIQTTTLSVRALFVP